MHAHAFDQYHFQESLIHRLDPRVKILATVGFILSNAILPDGSWLAFALAWLVLLFANEFSGLGIWFTLKRSFVALPFALVAISAIFSPLGEPLAEWQLGFITLAPTDLGVIRFFSIFNPFLALSADGNPISGIHPISRPDPCFRASAYATQPDDHRCLPLSLYFCAYR